jgi:hypothetical protein
MFNGPHAALCQEYSTLWRQDIVNQLVIGRFEGIYERNTIQLKSILQVFGNEMSHADAARRGPYHRIPECQPMYLYSFKRRRKVILLCDSHRKHRSPRIDRRSDLLGRYPRFAYRHIAELRESLQQQHTRPATYSSRHDVPCSTRLDGRGRSGGINQDVGIEADNHLSCISSRLNRAKRRPHGRPLLITSMA